MLDMTCEPQKDLTDGFHWSFFQEKRLESHLPVLESKSLVSVQIGFILRLSSDGENRHQT